MALPPVPTPPWTAKQPPSGVGEGLSEERGLCEEALRLRGLERTGMRQDQHGLSESLQSLLERLF